MYDLIIIGGGPGGAAGAIYAARKQLKTLLVTVEFGGQSSVSTDIQNWIGTPHISGADLAKNLKTHVMEYAGEFLTVIEGQKVNSVKKDGEAFIVETSDGKNHQTKTVLVTAGSSRRQLSAKGADVFEHKGLTYCASCDGPVFSGMPVVVVGGGNAGFETAAQLLAYCPSVTMLNRTETFRADEITVQKVLSHPNMKVVKNADILEVLGEDFVTGIIYKDSKTGETVTLPTNGIFVEIGQISNAGFIGDLVEKDEFGKIKIDAWRQTTSQPGIWAAGDVTNIFYHQNNIAAGDAVKAVEDIYQYIHTK
jgi:alkyl hydroperoxide reductase subunit F